MDITKVLAVLTLWLKIVGMLFLFATVTGSLVGTLALFSYKFYGQSALSLVVLVLSASLIIAIVVETDNL